jgi:hypothetical protein
MPSGYQRFCFVSCFALGPMPLSYRPLSRLESSCRALALGLFKKCHWVVFRFVLATLSKTLIIEQSYEKDAVVMYYYLFITSGSGGS